MKRLHKMRLWLRLLTVLSLVGLITTGVTYAALQSQQAVLANNTIESAVAALQVSKDGGAYSNSMTGFDFPNLIPGGPAMPSQYGGYPIWFKNSGSAPLNLNVSIGNTPTTTGGVDLTKVSVVLTPVGTSGSAQTIPIASLISSNSTGGMTLTLPPLAVGTTIEYKLQVQMAADAFSGSSATINSLDMVFGGTAATQ